MNIRNIRGKLEEIHVFLGIFNSTSLLAQANDREKRWKKAFTDRILSIRRKKPRERKNKCWPCFIHCQIFDRDTVETRLLCKLFASRSTQAPRRFLYRVSQKTENY